ncbi:MAG: DNA-3-methyladenine glycosylase I [Planctomycetota bacterium]|jgi:DNA-3-methyladenine glycosylase I
MTANIGIRVGSDGIGRCWWCGDDPLYVRYHDEEWGFPITDDRRLFEKICLEGFQAGLSWLTILRKREAFREAFRDFEPARVARFTARDVARLLRNAGIVRHRGKIESTVNNARMALAVANEAGSLASFVWAYAPTRRGAAGPASGKAIPARTPESEALSRDLKRRGWTYVGPTTMYAFMQSVGIVNDHLARCSIRADVERARRAANGSL